MQVTLDINPADLSLGILEILRSLSDEEKKKIAADVVKTWLDNSHDKEKELFEQEVVNRLMKSENKSASDVRNNYRYNEQMRSFKSCRDKMIERIYKEGEAYFQNVIKKEVQEHENYGIVFQECLEIIKQNFPMYVQQAMQKWFVDNLHQWSYSLQNVDVNIPTMQQSIDDIKNKLNSMGGLT